MNSRAMAIFGTLLAALTISPHTSALIFAQRGGRYDRNQNNISMEEAWNLGHAVGTMHGLNGTAIAPYWFVSAAHLAPNKPKVFDCPVGSFEIVEMVPLVGDMMLCRVNLPFRQYSRLLARPLESNEVVRLYGQSSAHWAGEALRGSDGQVKGWTLGAEARESMRLRWGLGRVTNVMKYSAIWPFTAYDPEIGTNCAGAVHMDSGGGMFLGSDLAGVLVSATSVWRARDSLDRSPEGCARSFIFDSSNLFDCSAPEAMKPESLSKTSAFPIALNLDAIYRKIAPPQRINAGGGAAGDWAGWAGAYPVIQFPAPTHSTGTNEPPSVVYGSAVFAQGTNMLTYPATNLLMTERYTLRLHFGSIPFLEAGEALQTVYVNGIERASQFDPVRESGPNRKPVVLEIRGLQPEEGSRASITLMGGGRKKLAYLSGLELILERR